MTLSTGWIEQRLPFGAVVHGLNLRDRPDAPTISAIESEVARHGFLVFPNQSLPGDTLTRVSEYFGSGVLAARHTTHSEAVHDDVLRLSNQGQHGVRAVGQQWHADGSFERAVFSHVIFHAQHMPPIGGGTAIADLGAAHDALPARLRTVWASCASVNAFSGAVHPLIHKHPLTGRRLLFLHLGQTGAIVCWNSTAGAEACRAEKGRRSRAPHRGQSAMDPSIGPSPGHDQRALGPQQVSELQRTFDALLSRTGIQTTYTYSTVGGAGDLLLLDNLAVAHRSPAEAHDPANGLRIIHRTTVAGTTDIDPPPASGLPPFLYIWGANPLEGSGVWQGSDEYGAGWRWNNSRVLRN